MNSSTFQQPIPNQFKPLAASGYLRDGNRVHGKWYIYPEMAAAGLWSTPSDLAHVMLSIQKSYSHHSDELLSSKSVREMLTPQIVEKGKASLGLGIFLKHIGENLVFFHNGQDEGFTARFFGFADLTQGFIVMTNSLNGWDLIEEITNSLADTYQWKGMKLKRELQLMSLMKFMKNCLGYTVQKRRIMLK